MRYNTELYRWKEKAQNPGESQSFKNQCRKYGHVFNWAEEIFRIIINRDLHTDRNTRNREI